MKRFKIVLAMLMIMGLVASNCSVAQAAEGNMVVVPDGRMTVEVLTEAEMALLQQEMSQTVIGGELNAPQATTASYTPYRYTDAFSFYLDDVLVGRAEIECIVWHYTDGKVHLYSREILMYRLATYDASRTYGRIVNTDGSLSYTTGDRAHLYGLADTWDFAIDFRVTPTDASFDCYEV